MDRKFLILFASAIFAMSANAQSQANAQSKAQTGTQVNVSGGGAQAQSSGNATATTSTSTQSNNSSATIADGTAINAALTVPVDSKKAKQGDEVAARTTEAVRTEGKTVIPKGTKLIGHVTHASARGRGDAESALGIAFDKAVLKGGQEVALNGSIQALASAETAPSASNAAMDSTEDVGFSGGGRAMPGGRSTLGGVASTASGAVGSVTNTAGNVATTAGNSVDATARSTTAVAGSTGTAVGGLNSSGQFVANSRGVFGLNGLNLSAADSNSTEGSLVTSKDKNVHLDSGTRMLIVAGAQNAENKSSAPNPKSNPPKPAAHSDSTKNEN